MRLARQRGAERNRTSQHASSRGGYISSGFGPGGWKGQDLQESWQPRYAASRCTMETAVRLESGAGECAHCHRLLPAAPDGQSPRAGANSGYGASRWPCASPPYPTLLRFPSSSPPLSAPPRLLSLRLAAIGSWAHVSSARLCSLPRRSGGFWRPWVDARGEQEEEEEEASHHTAEAVSERRVAGSVSEGCS